MAELPKMSVATHELLNAARRRVEADDELLAMLEERRRWNFAHGNDLRQFVEQHRRYWQHLVQVIERDGDDYPPPGVPMFER